MTTTNELSFSTKFAIGSFAIGTILLITYLLTRAEGLLMVGFIYVITAILLNALVVLNLLYEFIMNKRNREETAIRILIVLANIPIAFLYANIVFNSYKI